MGRKKAYDYEDPMFLLEMEGYARDGVDNKKIAEILGLSEAQFSRNVSKYPQLAQAIQKGRRPLHVIVENSWYKRIVGCKVTTETLQYKIKEDGSEELVGRTVVTQDLPPDAGAAKNWLMQKRPEIWNKQPHKVAATDPTGENQAGLVFVSAESFTEEQIQQFINKNISDQEDNDSTAGSND